MAIRKPRPDSGSSQEEVLERVEKDRGGGHTRVYIRIDWLLRAVLLMILNFLTSSEFYIPSFHFKATIPQFSHPPPEGADAADADLDDAGVSTSTAKLASNVEPEPEHVTSDLVEFSTEASHNGMSDQREVSTLTDVCYNENLAEVDLVSLIEEQIPRYILRADTLTDFAGYDNEDWIRTPCLSLDTDLDLSPIIIEETLKYFTLCAERISQMTKTYNDIEAVTRLLEEKERDLELAARIGQNLLEKNKQIEQRNEHLEEQLTEANEKVSQLRHEVSMKDALLQVYIQDYDSETPGESPTKPFLGLGHLDSLQKKVKGLEQENLTLRFETAELQVSADDLEEKEEKLVKDAVKHLSEVNNQISVLQDELFAKTEVTVRQQEDITNLMGKVIALETQIKKVAIENAELNNHLGAAQQSQRQLTTELTELTDKYHELLVLLQEAQEEAKHLRNKQGPSAVRQQYGLYTPFLPEGSLALELEDSLKKEMTYPEGYSPAERRFHNKRVMKTAQIVKKHAHRKSGSLMSIPGSNQSTSGNETCESIAGSSNRSSIYLSEGESFNESYTGDVDSNYGSRTTIGRPGIPGSNDLETALRRLTLRKANEINERILHDVDEKKSVESSTPTGYHTPDSLMSTGSGSNFSDLSRFSGYSGYGFRIPEKLQIVKPMEGSMTLHQWQRLATPHLGGFLDPRPGVQIKGETPIELDQEVYRLSDYEEDGEADYKIPGKEAVWSNSTYTYTTAKIMHPTDQYDNTALTSIYSGGPRPSVTGAEGEAPCSRNASNCTSTFSMNLGLASLLKERGIQVSGFRSPAPIKKMAAEPMSPYLRPRIRHTPQRFGSIVTETLSGATRSYTEVIYTSATTNTVCTSTNIPPFEGISDTAMPLLLPDSYDIVDQVKGKGFVEMVSTTAAAVNILGTGLNTILPVNEKIGLATRQDAAMATKQKTGSPMATATKMSPVISPTANTRTVISRPSYLGDLPPLGSSGGVMTRLGIPPGMKQGGSSMTVGMTTSSTMASASMCSTLNTLTSSSSMYSSPISYGGPPASSKGASQKGQNPGVSETSESTAESSSGSTKLGPLSSVGTSHMSPSLLKHLANIRMRRRNAGMLRALTGTSRDSGLAAISSLTSPESPRKSGDVD